MVLASELYRIAFTSEDFPEPLTPVTAMSLPSGKSTVISRRLFSMAPCTVINRPFPALRAAGRAISQGLKEFFLACGLKLVDFKIEFGKTSGGEIILADEISPDTCRLWDVATNKKMDKDRFRRDLGDVEETYQEVFERIKNNG